MAGQQPTDRSAGANPGIGVNRNFTARFQGQVVPPISGDYTFTADTDGQVTIFVNGRQVTSTRTLGPPENDKTCSPRHCNAGAAISKTCSQGLFCASQICTRDPACCAHTWDARCVQEVGSLCGLDCNPVPPIAISLQAGVKVDIEVDYAHRGPKDETDAKTFVHGARLQLKWALPGTLSEVIPRERQFAGAGAPGLPPGTPQVCDTTTMRFCGVGLNAAYFVPDTTGNPFGNEVLDHVEGPIALDGTTTPGIGLSPGIVCGAALGQPACSPATPVPGAPAITSPATGSPVSGPITIAGSGAVRGAPVAIYECAIDAATGECQRNPVTGLENWTTLVATTAPTTPASPACDHPASSTELCGAFSIPNVSLSPGTHWLAAAQFLAAATGEGRIRLVSGPAPDLFGSRGAGRHPAAGRLRVRQRQRPGWRLGRDRRHGDGHGHLQRVEPGDKDVHLQRRRVGRRRIHQLAARRLDADRHADGRHAHERRRAARWRQGGAATADAGHAG